MIFSSILFAQTKEGLNREIPGAPAFFPDLNLDQVIDAMTAGREEYDLKPLFYTPLSDIDTLLYRQEVMQDLENKDLFELITSFSQKMQVMRRYLTLADKLYYKYNKEGWFLNAAGLYCEAVRGLVRDLSVLDLKSRGLSAFREYLTDYAHSDRFESLFAKTKKLEADLSAVKYCLLIQGNRVKVRKYEGEDDYSVEVESTFEKFKQGAVKDYRVAYSPDVGLNHVDAKILDYVALLYPEIFSNLDLYCAENCNFPDEKVVAFDREVQFYIACLEHVALFKRAGLNFCYPQISMDDKDIHNDEGFDLALAYKLIANKTPVVCNSFFLKGKERIFVVSGPNQGGKTTFARIFGQLHYLAGIGCPVPGRKARLFLSDGIFTHFEKEENIENLRGKLQDDLIRIHDILDKATSKSVIILNEIFTSTTLEDAVSLSKQIMKKIIELDALCVWVTFIDELASFSEKTVSMVSTVVPENPALRTYKIIRRTADGLAYALSIAEKFRLTYDHIVERIKL